MPLNTNGFSAAVGGVTAVAGFISIHTALPNASGSNESTAARKAATYSGSGATRSLAAPLMFTGGAASGPALYAGLWSSLTGGTFYGSIQLTGDLAFNSVGEYTITNLTISVA